MSRGEGENGGELVVRAPAKVNLFLEVIGRRPDGYHELATLMQKIDLVDVLRLRVGPAGIRLRCPGAALPEDDGNLVFRAAARFFEAMACRLPPGAGVDLVLEKHIPVAAGLGGGSSDAAAALRGLDRLFGAGCGEAELLDLARELGADVAFFIPPMAAAWATGIGDCLQQAVALDGWLVLLVNPGFALSTKWVYGNLALTAEPKTFNLKGSRHNGTIPAPARFVDRAIRPDELRNDLERVSIGAFPEIERIKRRLLTLGAQAALMSGSGPTVFGLFAEQDQAAETARNAFLNEYQEVHLVRCRGAG